MTLPQIAMFTNSAGTYDIKIKSDINTPADLGTDQNPLKTDSEIALGSLDTTIFIQQGIAKVHFYDSQANYNADNKLFTLTHGVFDAYKTIRQHMQDLSIPIANEPMQNLYLSFTLSAALDPMSPGHFMRFTIAKAIINVTATIHANVMNKINAVISLMTDSANNDESMLALLNDAKQELTNAILTTTPQVVTEDHGYKI